MVMGDLGQEPLAQVGQFSLPHPPYSAHLRLRGGTDAGQLPQGRVAKDHKSRDAPLLSQFPTNAANYTARGRGAFAGRYCPSKPRSNNCL